MRTLRICLYLCLAGLIFNTLQAEDSVEDLRSRRPHQGNILTDAGQFLKDVDTQTADLAAIAADRAAMAVDLNNSAALRADVVKFFGDRGSAFAIDFNIILDRKQFRLDVRPQTGPLQKPPVGPTDLSAAITQFQTDFNARTAAEAAIDVDLANLNVSVLQQNSATVTTNGNTYFHDRHSFFQNRLYEAADVFNIKKLVSFKGQRATLTKPARGQALMTHVQQFLNDRAAWLTSATAITAARNNMFAAIGTASLQDSVTTWLNARHTHHVDGLQLAIDRQAMKGDLRHSRFGREVMNENAGHGDGADDSLDVPSTDLDQSDEDNGEK